MLRDLYRSKGAIPNVDFHIDNKYIRIAAIQSSSGGVLDRSSQFEEVDFSKMYSNVTSDDFSIANIVELGASQMLRPVSMTPVSNFGTISTFENVELNNSGDVPKA